MNDMFFGFAMMPFMLVCMAVYFIPAALAIWQLRSRAMAEKERLLWVLIIVVAPLLGAVAFFIFNSGREKQPLQ